MRYSLGGGVRQKFQNKTVKLSVAAALALAGIGGGVSAALAGLVFAASPANEYVNGAGADTGDCSTQAAACKTISYALTQADNGTKIHVAAGNYTESLVIDKEVSLLGAGPSTTITVPSTLTGGGKIVDIAAPNVTLKDLTVSGKFNVPDCSASEYGVYFENGASGAISGVSVLDIQASNASLFGCQQGIGIRIGSQYAGISAKATLTNVTVSGYQKGGIVVDGGGSYALIKGSTITGAGAIATTAQNGIQVSRSATATIENDTITGNSYTLTSSNGATAAGILLYGAGDKTTVKEDTITNNQVGYFTENQANLRYLSLTGITGNTRNAVAWIQADYAPAWAQPLTTYAVAGLTGASDSLYGSDIVNTPYGLHVYGYDAFPSIQSAINAVTTSGRVYVANGSYDENINIDKSGLKVYGQSEAGVQVTPVGGGSGYGVTINGQTNTHLQDLTISVPAAIPNLNYAMQAYHSNGVYLTDLSFAGPGKNSSPHIGGVDLNSSQNVSYNNVSASNFSKNGFSVTAKYDNNDTASKNITFNGITADSNGWAGIAFYTVGNDHSPVSTGGANNITGVHFNGNNIITNNGNGGPTQGGIFIEGGSDTDLFGFYLSGGTYGTPAYTVTTSSHTLDLGNTNFSGNSSDVTNFQADGVSALAATFGGLTGNQMTAAQRITEDGLIYDQLDSNTLGLVQYHNIPAVPTGLELLNGAGHQITNGGYTNSLNVTAQWDSISDADHYIYKYWNNITASPYNTEASAWTTTVNGTSQAGTFNQGEGTHYIEVAACNSNGCSAFTSPFTVTYDATPPAAPALGSPSNGAVVNGKSLTQSWSDSSSDVDHYIYQSYSDQAMKHLRFTTTYTTTSKTATNVAETTYWWRLAAVDHAGNQSGWSDLWEITVDNTPPAMIVDNLSIADTTPTITGTVNDPLATVSINVNSRTYSANVSNTVNKVGTYDWSADVTNTLAVGNYAITATATDAAGNIGSASGTLGIVAPAAPHLVLGAVITGGRGGSNLGSNGNSGSGSNSSQDSGSTPKVLGATTTNDEDNGGQSGNSGYNDQTFANINSDKATAFLGLGWWWLAILAAILVLIAGLYSRATRQADNG